MRKFYFGIWGNLYGLSWPVRFLIELIVIIFLMVGIFKVLKKILYILGLKAFIVKMIAFMIKEISYFFGKNKDWVVNTDARVNAWGNKKLSKEIQDTTNKHKGIIFVGILVIYILAIFEDIPVSGVLNQYYIGEIGCIKRFFLEMEAKLSNGYSEYPPLLAISKKTTSESVKIEAEENQTDIGKVDVYIRLNEKGKNGSNIRATPSLDGHILDTVDADSQIVYNNKVEYDGKRYWINIRIADKEIEGWISGKLIDSDQLADIIK